VLKAARRRGPAAGAGRSSPNRPPGARLLADPFLCLPVPADPFADIDADAAKAAKSKNSEEENYVHIRVQQRNGRKSLTTIQGLQKGFDYKKVLKAFKKEFCCNGTVVDDEELGQVIQLQGDQRKNVSVFLTENKIAKKDKIKIHGF